MIRKLPFELITALLVILFTYTAISKILEADTFAKQMLNQPLPGWFSKTLVWIVPASELIASLLLLIKPLRYYGLIFSFLLLLAFTIYVALILSHSFNYVPCSCGGVLQTMSWQVHLIFNIGFTLLAVTGVLVERKKRIHA